MRFWFDPVGPLNLGICRALFFGAFFLFYLRVDFSAWGGVSDHFWMPSSVFIKYLPVFSGGLLVVLQTVWKVSLALSCIGLFTRVSTVSSFVLGFYLVALPHNFGKVGHSDAIVVFVFAIMALSRCGDGFSVDRWLRDRRRRGETPIQHPQASGEYTWPVRAVWLVFALIFFAAGVSKLRHSGLEWIFSDNMSLMLVRQNELNSADVDHPLVSWGLALAEYVWLTQLLAAGTILLEVGYPLALFSRRARWLIVPGVFCMQIGIRLLIGPTFYQIMICNLFWIPWDRVYYRFFKDSRAPRRHPLPRAKEPADHDAAPLERRLW